MTVSRIAPSKLIWAGIATAATFWILDSSIHYFVYGEPAFELLPNDVDEIWMRSLICLLIFVFGLYAHVTLRRFAAAHAEQEALRARLEDSLTRVVDGFVPICAQCKSIQDNRGNWIEVSEYLDARTDAQWSHGLCPDCLTDLKQLAPTSR